MSRYLSIPILGLSAALTASIIPHAIDFFIALLSNLTPVLNNTRGQLSLVMLFVLCWSIRGDLADCLIWALVGGIALDLLSILPLGTTSIVLILIAFVANSVAQQLFSVRLFFLIAFTSHRHNRIDRLYPVRLGASGPDLRYPGGNAPCADPDDDFQFPSCNTSLCYRPPDAASPGRGLADCSPEFDAGVYCEDARVKSNRLIPFQTWRLTFFQAVIFAVFLIFGIRMYELQVLQHNQFQGKADENRLKSLPIAARRGAIFDRNDQRLAFNVPAFNVTIIPAQLPGSEEEELAVYNRLSALVDVPPTREIAEQS